MVWVVVVVLLEMRGCQMRTNDKNEVILTKKKAAEIFLLLRYARNKVSGKPRSDCEKYLKEFEKVFGLELK